MPFVDFHTHLSIDQDAIEVLSCDYLQEKIPDSIHTIGYHPWWTDRILTNHDIEDIRQHYVANDNCIAFGECGLDKLKGLPMQDQFSNFIKQVELAASLDAALVIHCVRAYDELIQLKLQYPKQRWIIHGYARNAQLCLDLVRHGFYLSIAPDEWSVPTFVETMQKIPLDKLFLETDADERLTIAERYRIFAQIRNVPLHALQERILHNCITVFKDRWK